MTTTIKSEVFNQADQQLVTCKAFIRELPDFKELYLSEMDSEKQDGDEEDHLFIQITKEKEVYINGRAISHKMVKEIINFISI
ncbi:hypothetical protein [Pedobacter cryoconitis]|nr:hypothetical protein [Pedobacter cryoconitis]